MMTEGLQTEYAPVYRKEPNNTKKTPMETTGCNIGKTAKNPTGIFGFFYVTAYSHVFMQQVINWLVSV